MEYDPDMAAFLTGCFAGVDVIEGDAFDLAHTLGGKARGEIQRHRLRPAAAQFPPGAAAACMEGIARLLAPGAPFIQFSYGVQAAGGAAARPLA